MVQTVVGREEEIARLVALGRTNKEVSFELGVSPKTVEWHLSRLYRKLGVRSRTELSVFIHRQQDERGQRSRRRRANGLDPR